MVDTAFGRDDVSVLTASENHTARVRTFTSWLPLLSTIRVPCTEPCYAIIQSVCLSVCLSVPLVRSDPCKSRKEVRRNFKTWQQCSPRAHVTNDLIFEQKGHRSRSKVRVTRGHIQHSNRRQEVCGGDAESGCSAENATVMALEERRIFKPWQ